MMKSQAILGTKPAAVVLVFIAAIGLITCSPVARIQAKYGAPASVALFRVANVGGVFVVSNGLKSSLIPVGMEKIHSISEQIVQADLQHLAAQNSPADPRFCANDSDTYIIETWKNGAYHRIERDSSDEEAGTQFARRFLEMAQQVHHNECS